MKKFDMGHFRSQKFAGFVFAVFICFAAGMFQVSEASTQAVVMGVVALYGAFAGTRTMSDNAALKFGANVGTPEVPAKKTVPPKKKKEDEREVD